MDPIYADIIHSFGSDLDNLWRDKHAFNSVKSPVSVSIEDGNFCSFQRFMMSTISGTTDNTDINAGRHTRDWRPTTNQTIPLIDRLAKTAAIWTLPGISRVDADKILQEFEPGIFVVRMNSEQKTMVLSYRIEDKSQHVMIKVDQKKGFYMDGSQNIFRNVNIMIEYYMKHPIQTPELRLKLPRALMEAHEAVHFQFFENMKINFWTTLLANKSINDIWSKTEQETKSADNSVDDQSETCPPLPPRGYLANEFHIIQGMADVSETDDDYQQIQKKDQRKPQTTAPPAPPPPPQTKSTPIVERVTERKVDEERIYSQIWQWHTDENGAQIPGPLPNSRDDKCPENRPQVPPRFPVECEKRNEYDSDDVDLCFTIPSIIEKYYPQLVSTQLLMPVTFQSFPSLKDELLHGKKPLFPVQDKPEKEAVIVKVDDKVEEPIYQSHYETPWDVKNTWLTKLMDLDQMSSDNQKNSMTGGCVSELKPQHDKPFGSISAMPNSKFYMDSSPDENELLNNKDQLESTDDDDEEFKEDEDRLQVEFLGDIQPVMFSPSPTNQRYSQQRSQYGQSIRRFLTKLCSRRGKSEISNTVRLFISCTVARNDLSPYTTMRLIRQFMCGLKNLITKNKDGYSLTDVINEEINNTPKNVFINLDSIIESVLTKSVVKPLRIHVYKLLILEHYKNNNLKLIADGVETSRSISLEKLGLQNNEKSIIDSKIELIRQKFKLISKQYSPEKKIKYMITIVNIVFSMLKLIYPASEFESMQIDIKSDNILPLFVYIFSQCKLDAVSTQCEVEYVEGLIWSSKLVNGEPGFFLLNLMSALEAIKVLARHNMNAAETIELSDQNAIRISNSSFFTKIKPSTVSDASIGSVNVIILDEKINRLVTKSFPVRSTVTVNYLCNTIAYRLGIFDPSDYSLYKYNGFDESLLNDHDYPLLIKQTHQQKTGENISFLFKRNNANFILPSDISVR